MKKDIILGKYQHYKGNFYNLIGIANHSETLEELVIYQGLYDSKEFGANPIWIRPKKLFFDEKELNETKIPRFKLIEANSNVKILTTQDK